MILLASGILTVIMSSTSNMRGIPASLRREGREREREKERERERERERGKWNCDK